MAPGPLRPAKKIVARIVVGPQGKKPVFCLILGLINHMLAE